MGIEFVYEDVSERRETEVVVEDLMARELGETLSQKLLGKKKRLPRGLTCHIGEVSRTSPHGTSRESRTRPRSSSLSPAVLLPAPPAAPPVAPKAVPPQVAAADVSEASFAAALSAVIARPGSTVADHGRRLGVVRRQLVHAARRFELGADDRAMSSVFGALYLLREGESAAPLVDAETERAFTGALARVSARGDTGRARALLRLVREAAEKKRIRRNVPDFDGQLRISTAGSPTRAREPGSRSSPTWSARRSVSRSSIRRPAPWTPHQPRFQRRSRPRSS